MMNAGTAGGWRAQLVRYLSVGAFNTVLGYGLFVGFNRAFSMLPRGYVLASLAANSIAVTTAFLSYKWFVFRTRGNYLKEWLRCIAVYSGNIVAAAAGIAVLVPLMQRSLRLTSYAPYLAAAVMAVVTAMASFFGHKHFSFARVQADPR